MYSWSWPSAHGEQSTSSRVAAGVGPIVRVVAAPGDDDGDDDDGDRDERCERATYGGRGRATVAGHGTQRSGIRARDERLEALEREVRSLHDRGMSGPGRLRMADEPERFDSRYVRTSAP